MLDGAEIAGAEDVIMFDLMTDRAMTHRHIVCALTLAMGCLAMGCSGAPTPSPQQRQLAAQSSVAKLQAADFAEAETLAGAVLARDRDNPVAGAVRALSRYVLAMHRLVDEVEWVIEDADRRETNFDHPRMRAALDLTARTLAEIDDDLAIASGASDFALELCLACWERDWNRSGEVDRRDRLLFQIEIDAEGRRIPEGDPRRKPTFHFDVGDVHWARAMLSFQRATIELILAYRWTELDKLFSISNTRQLPVITIRLDKAGRVARGRDLILAGLGHANSARRHYLAETDDDREWVPNPNQRSYALPLPVGKALYETWAGVLRDVRGLISGTEGLSIAEIAQLGDHRWADPPGGFLDLGGMLSRPKNIVFDLNQLYSVAREPGDNIEPLLASIFGDYYVRDMKPTPLVQRLARMKRELERGEDTFERKLRYLLWLN